MFCGCFKRQNNDEDEYHQRPKTRNASQSSSRKPIHTARTNEGSEVVRSLEQLQNECLAAHNKYRAKHGVSPLTLNKEMCSYASEWAKHLAETSTLQHRKNNKYGENVYMGSGMGPQTHELAVQAWYDEIKNYNFNKPGFSPSNGHFTQVVWKTSKELGVGIETKNNRTWIVCNYEPTGNLMGNYEKCVPPLVEETVSKIIDKMKPKKLPSKTTMHKMDNVTAIHSEKDLKIWTQFELDCLVSHNKFRALHGSPVMKLDRKLCNFAQDWATHLAKKNALSHRPENNYGENIYYAMDFDPTAEHCVKSWYDEIKNYNYSKPGFSSQTGHFTQVVWRDSIELGVGISKLNNKTFVVCNYSPAGNVMNEYMEQVARPGESPCTTSNVFKESKNNKKSVQQQQEQPPVQSFEEVCLNTHNDFRAIHGSPAMSLNKNLNFLANDWAQHLAKNNKFETRKNNRFGENIYYANNQEIEAKDPVAYWYSGIQDYNFNRPQYTPATGSFTQIIWKSSLRLGVGVAKVGRSTYVVCNYEPRGNILNKFVENIPPVGGGDVLLASNTRTPSQVDEFTQKILKTHNVYRENHGCPPLKLSQELMDFSSSYANQLLENKPATSQSQYAINFLILQDVMPSPNLIVSQWYNEIENYDFENPAANNNTQHFTQIIWKDTKFLGVAMKSSSEGRTVVVLSYEPPGNVENQYEENVPTPVI